MKGILKYTIFFAFLFLSFPGLSQCWVSLSVEGAAVDTVEICHGDSVTIDLTGELIVFFDDFNDGNLGNGWSHITPGVTTDYPCDSVQTVKCAWFGENTPVQRAIATTDLDLSPGGDIEFDLKFGLQGDMPSCEGPDEMWEGVSFQYSTDFGQTWTDIIYFCPNGTMMPTNPMVQSPLTFTPTPFTEWANYSFSVPADAQTPHTRFRWMQSMCSYFNNHFDDNWGLDNIKVTRNFGPFTQWSTGSTSPDSLLVSPAESQTYYAVILGGGVPPDTLAIDSIHILVHAVPDPAFTGDLDVCQGESTVISAVGDYTYLWSTGSQAATIYAGPEQTTTFWITATDYLGCTGTDSVQLVVHPLPNAMAYGDTICIGETAMLSASGGISYLWSNAAAAPQILVTPDQTTLYNVTVTDQFGCQKSAGAVVKVYPLPVVVTTSDTSVCYGEPATIYADGGLHYYWNTGGQSPVITVCPPVHTTYTVTVVDAHQCQSTGMVTVFVAPEPVPVINSDADTICRGSEARLTASGAAWFNWSTGDTAYSILVQPGFTTTYFLTATIRFNDILCSAETSFELSVEECSNVFIPNAFCPKGYNPVFGPVGDFSTIHSYSMRIFDRWGKLLFESVNPEHGWDGRYQGEFLPSGSYIYQVRFAKSLSDESVEKVGSVLIVE